MASPTTRQQPPQQRPPVGLLVEQHGAGGHQHERAERGDELGVGDARAVDGGEEQRDVEPEEQPGGQRRAFHVAGDGGGRPVAPGGRRSRPTTARRRRASARTRATEPGVSAHLTIVELLENTRTASEHRQDADRRERRADAAAGTTSPRCTVASVGTPRSRRRRSAGRRRARCRSRRAVGTAARSACSAPSIALGQLARPSASGRTRPSPRRAARRDRGAGCAGGSGGAHAGAPSRLATIRSTSSLGRRLADQQALHLDRQHDGDDDEQDADGDRADGVPAGVVGDVRPAARRRGRRTGRSRRRCPRAARPAARAASTCG